MTKKITRTTPGNFTIRWERTGRTWTRVDQPARDIEALGRMLAIKDGVTNIEVLDHDRNDVTFDFACFR